MVVGEVGGAVGCAPLEAQVELFDSLIEGCTGATKEENMGVKVGHLPIFINEDKSLKPLRCDTLGIALDFILSCRVLSWTFLGFL